MRVIPLIVLVLQGLVYALPLVARTKVVRASLFAQRNIMTDKRAGMAWHVGRAKGHVIYKDGQSLEFLA